MPVCRLSPFNTLPRIQLCPCAEQSCGFQYVNLFPKNAVYTVHLGLVPIIAVCMAHVGQTPLIEEEEEKEEKGEEEE